MEKYHEATYALQGANEGFEMNMNTVKDIWNYICNEITCMESQLRTRSYTEDLNANFRITQYDNRRKKCIGLSADYTWLEEVYHWKLI